MLYSVMWLNISISFVTDCFLLLSYFIFIYVLMCMCLLISMLVDKCNILLLFISLGPRKSPGNRKSNSASVTSSIYPILSTITKNIPGIFIQQFYDS